MQLHHQRDIEHLPAEHTFRVSPLVMLMLPLILLAACIGMGWAMIAEKLPPFFWLSIVIMAPIVPLVLWINFVPALRSTNWVLKVAGGRFYVMLRSFRNPHTPDDGPTVVSFTQHEIESVGKQVLMLSSPAANRGRKTYWTEYRLELRLREAAPPELAAALQAERDRRPPQVGIVRSGSFSPSHVTLDGDGRTIRILWWGRFDWVTPRINKALALLSRTLLRHEDTVINRRNVDAMSEADFDRHVLRLLEGGLRLDAVKLLTQQRGMSTTEAMRFTDDLLSPSR